MNSASDWRGKYVDTRWPLLHTRLLDASICSLIKPAALEKVMSFRAKIHTVML